MRALDFTEVIVLEPINVEVLGALRGPDQWGIPEHFSHLWFRLHCLRNGLWLPLLDQEQVSGKRTTFGIRQT